MTHLAPTMTHLRMVPYLNPKHNEGHIHCALPIHGLLMENKQHNGKSPDKHNDNGIYPWFTNEEMSTENCHQLSQNICEKCTPMTAGTPPELDQILELINLLDPPLLLDAKGGPVAVMQVIDEWFDYQDHLKTTQQPSQLNSYNVGDRHYQQTATSELPLKWQLEDNLCQSAPIGPVMQQGASLVDQWVTQT